MKVIHGEWVEQLEDKMWEAVCSFGYNMRVVKNVNDRYKYFVETAYSDIRQGTEGSLEKAKAKAEKAWATYVLQQLERTIEGEGHGNEDR
jgi:hypothetical protein